MSKNVIETVTFTLNDGISRNDFAAAAVEMNAWVAAQPGFIRRRLSCTSEGTWIEHIQWENMAAAKTAADQIGKQTGNVRFQSAINGPSVQITHSELEVAVN